MHYKIYIHFVFHRLEKTLCGEMFSTAELSHIRKFMQIALDDTETVGYNITLPHSLINLISSVEQQLSSAVVIVDPEIGKVIAQAQTDSSHPLRHATMVCLDHVASLQGGGAWGKTHSTRHDEPIAETWQALKQELGETDDLNYPPAKRIKCQYLCTGYDAYCTTEPCVMYVSIGATDNIKKGRVFL